MQCTHLSFLSASNRALHEGAERETKTISPGAISPVSFQDNRGKKLMVINSRKTCYLINTFSTKHVIQMKTAAGANCLVRNHQHLDLSDIKY